MEFAGEATRKLRRCCCRLCLFELRRRACGSKEGAHAPLFIHRPEGRCFSRRAAVQRQMFIHRPEGWCFYCRATTRRHMFIHKT
jgi:hypothetical protein